MDGVTPEAGYVRIPTKEEGCVGIGIELKAALCECRATLLSGASRVASILAEANAWLWRRAHRRGVYTAAGGGSGSGAGGNPISARTRGAGGRPLHPVRERA